MSTLDDFFAKKDRKKKGIKLNDGSKDKETVRKEKIVDITDNFKYINDNDEEWLDFEENRDKDYSGLKIQALCIKDKEQVVHEQRLADAHDESKDGPVWSGSKAAQTSAAASVDEQSKEEETIKEEETKKEPEVKKYVPPSQRSNQSEVPKRIVIKNRAPELESKSEFPTL